jgi:hypothetical protein
MVCLAHCRGRDFLFEANVSDSLHTAFRIKADIRAYVQEIGLPSLVIHCGLHPEIMFHKSSSFGFNVDKCEVRLPGNGSQQISWTTGIDGEPPPSGMSC